MSVFLYELLVEQNFKTAYRNKNMVLILDMLSVSFSLLYKLQLKHEI